MNQNEQQRHQSEIDSRRVSTGVRCDVITNAWGTTVSYEEKGIKYTRGNGLLGILLHPRNSDFLPSNDFDTYDSLTGFNPVNRQCYVVPKTLVGHVKTLLRKHQVLHKKLEKNMSEVQRAETEFNNKMYAKDLLTAIQDHVFLVTLQTAKIDGIGMEGNSYDVYMHSREQSAPYAEMVDKDKVERGVDEGNVTWTKKVQDGQERFRNELKAMDKELAKEVTDGRSARRK